MRPVLIAAMVGSLPIVQMLVEAGCNCTIVNKVLNSLFCLKYDSN